ncbi:type III secretion system translocon subunit SctE, partial [Yersinia enterocolitica]
VNKEQTAGGLANAEDAYKSALFLSDTAANSANKAFEAITEAEKSYPASLIAPAETRSSTIGRYIELIATLLQVINESNIESIKMQSKLSKDVNQARLNEMQKQADEIEKKQQAANKLRKALSIFAAIVGAILAVVGVVAAIPSGGMTLAGGIGLGVALVSAAFVATDIALQFTIDFSPMGVAFDKINKGISYIVEYTLSQIVKGLALLCDASTEDADKAKEYCTQITSAILTTLVLMLPMIVAGVGLSQAASKGVNAAAQATQASVNAATTAAVKTATDVVQQTVNTVSKATKLAAVLVRSAEIARVVAMALNTVVAPTVNIVIGVNTKEAYDALAKLGINKDEIKILSGIGKNQTKQIQSASDISQELNKQICEVLSERAQAMQTGYRNVERLGIA